MGKGDAIRNREKGPIYYGGGMFNNFSSQRDMNGFGWSRLLSRPKDRGSKLQAA